MSSKMIVMQEGTGEVAQLPKFRTPYDGVRVKVVHVSSGKSRTKQSFKDECDINVIMRKYENTGVISHLKKFNGEYGDFSVAGDYHASMNVVANAQQMFMSLPARIRSRFGNDPAQYLDFCLDPNNREEMVKMGLAKPDKDAVAVVKATADDAAKAASAVGANDAPKVETK